MKKEEYEQYISENNLYQHLLTVDNKFHVLMQKYGIKCKLCSKPFIPEPYFHNNYPNAYHYPTETICGFCVYDMDSLTHSELSGGVT